MAGPLTAQAILDAIGAAWAWRGVSLVELIDLNPFGNAILVGEDGDVWRACPELLTLERIAADRQAFHTLRTDPDFEFDWRMERLVELAQAKLGPLPHGRCYYFVIPPVLGGGFDVDNIQSVSVLELHELTGDIARQIDELPDGEKVELRLAP